MSDLNLVLKAKKQKVMANKELLANLYPHLLEECFTAGAVYYNKGAVERAPMKRASSKRRR